MKCIERNVPEEMTGALRTKIVLVGILYIFLTLASAVAAPVSEMHEAVIKGDFETVRSFVKDGVDLDAIDTKGRTMLQLAAGNGHLEIVEYLVSRGADVNKRNINGTALIFAVATDKLAIARYLVQNGARVQTKTSKGASAIHYSKTKEMTEYLISIGSKAGSITLAGESPLHDANTPGEAEALIANGVDIHLKSRKGNTALHRAAMAGRVDVTRFLLDSGARISEIGEGGNQPIHHASAFSNNPEIVRLLLQRGASTSLRNARGRTPLQIAVIQLGMQLGRNHNDRNMQRDIVGILDLADESTNTCQSSFALGVSESKVLSTRCSASGPNKSKKFHDEGKMNIIPFMRTALANELPQNACVLVSVGQIQSHYCEDTDNGSGWREF